MERLVFLSIIFLLISSGWAIYSAHSDVTQLTVKTFDKTSKGVWLVEFYAPWCGHCQRLAPEYEKAAKALKGIGRIAAINADAEKVNVQIKGFPTIKLFIDGKSSDYSGERTAKGIIDFMLGQFKKVHIVII
jgi:protein disulfide-isomerase A6